MAGYRGGNAFMVIDGRELEQLVADLSKAPGRVQRGAPKTLRRSAALVDVAMKEDASGHRHLSKGAQNLAKHVSHEMLDPFTAEIGIEYKGIGKIAHIIAFGSVNNAPVYDKDAGLRRSEPQILEWFAQMGEDSVLGVKQA